MIFNSINYSKCLREFDCISNEIGSVAAEAIARKLGKSPP